MGERRIAILGSTGSIGRQGLEVIASQADLSACALGAGGNWRLLAEQAREHRPQYVALADADGARELAACLPADTKLLVGEGAMSELVRLSRPDTLLTAMVGAAGLEPTLAGIECGCDLAIANKETLVMAGAIIMPAARRAGVAVLPVDSEHSAILQCLASGRRDEVRRVTVTASGGALRDMSDDQAERATVEQALRHPTWQMGPKITIDSATLINKALELVEAHWLFDLSADELGVVIHPESIVHSLVEFCDASVIAQLARPDMRTPIAYALCYPRRIGRDQAELDLASLGRLTFEAPRGRFARACELGLSAIRMGGLAGAVLNSANEQAVQAFMEGAIPFGHIVPIVQQALDDAPRARDEVSLQDLLEADAWTRQRVRHAVSKCAGGA